MFIKQASFYVIPGNIDFDTLATALSTRPFQHCNGLDWYAEGWVPPAGHVDGPVFTSRGTGLVALKREDKVLPAATIREHLDAKVAEIEDKDLRKVGRKEKQALKEQVTDDLLPRAFTRSGWTMAYIDNRRGYLVVDTATASKSEALVSKLREALPPFPAALPRTQIAPHAAMTAWLAEGEAPPGFDLDAECELKDASENGAIIRAKRHDLTADEIRQHIATGKQCTRLGLIYRERIRFVLTDQLQLRSVQFLDVLQEEAAQAGDDRGALFEAACILMVEEFGELLDELVEALGGLEEAQQAGTTTAPTAYVTDAVKVEAVDALWVEDHQGQQDALYDKAVAIVLGTRKASISSVQRHLQIGYNRAARLIKSMEVAGVVGPMDGNGNRSVLR